MTMYKYKATKINNWRCPNDSLFCVTPETVYNYHATCTAHFLSNSTGFKIPKYNKMNMFPPLLSILSLVPD